MTLDVFEPLTFHARRSGRCPCGRTTERAKTFHDAVNPLHVDPDTGRPKTRDQVLADLAAEAAQWVPDFYCRSHSWVPVVIDIERFGDDWRDLYRVGPAHGSRRGAERAGREPGRPRLGTRHADCSARKPTGPPRTRATPEPSAPTSGPAASAGRSRARSTTRARPAPGARSA